MPETSEKDPQETLVQLTKSVLGQQSLTSDEAATAAEALADSKPSLEAKESFLRALAAKGESPSEVAAFAKTFRERAINPGLSDWASRAIDIVGTGGDRSGTFNFSTATALLLAAMEVPVMKHGNRSITSKSGSADLLAALGVPMSPTSDWLKRSLEENHFCFFFAPSFHPAFKEIMPVRKRLAETGTKTIFNLLGPLINPGQPAHQLMGVFASHWVHPIAAALEDLGLTAAMVVHSKISESSGVDEMTVAGENQVVGVGSLKGITIPADPTDLGLKAATLADIAGGDAAENLTILRSLANGAAQGPMEDTLCLNAGAALQICGRSPDLISGIQLARESLRSGLLTEWLLHFQTFNRTHS